MTSLVSCFYTLSSERERNWEDYAELSELLMESNLPLVFFSNEEKILEWVNTKRQSRPTRLIHLPFSQTLMYPYKSELEERMKTHTVQNLNTKKDTVDYILLQANKIDFLQKAMATNYFSSTYFIWIDFGIQHCAKATKEQWLKMEEDLEAVLKEYPDKIHHLKISPVQKDPNVSWKDYFQYIYHNIAGGMFGGSIQSLQEYTELFIQKWTQILNEGWYQLDEAIMTILTEEHPEKFRFWYGDYDGILCNIRISRTSLPLIFNNIQLYLDFRDYEKAKKILQTVDPIKEEDIYRFLELFIQTDYYVNAGCFSDQLANWLENFPLSPEFLTRQLPNLLYYKKDPKLYRILFKQYSRKSLENWNEFRSLKPKLIYMNQSKEFPFLHQYGDRLLSSFRKQFPNEKSGSVYTFYDLLENPKLPLAFFWTHPPPLEELKDLSQYLARNYTQLNFRFVFLSNSVGHLEDAVLLPFFLNESLKGTEEETRIMNEWFSILFVK